MRAKICISVAADTVPKLIGLIEKAESLGADLIEVRFDYLNVIGEVKRVAKSTPIPIIATNRRYDQGGGKKQDEERRIQTLLEASMYGFEFVDVELVTPNLTSIIERIRDLGSEVIVSHHIFDGTPPQEEMERLIKVMISKGAHICKLVTTAESFNDNIACLNVVKKMSKDVRVVCFAMGEKGLLSRVLSPIVGGYFTYASLSEGSEVAPGQLSFEFLKNLYEALGV